MFCNKDFDDLKRKLVLSCYVNVTLLIYVDWIFPLGITQISQIK